MKFTAVVRVPLQTVWLDGRFTLGVGLTVTVTEYAVGLVHPVAVKEYR